MSSSNLSDLPTQLDERYKLCSISVVSTNSNFNLTGNPEELVRHGLTALRETLPAEQELSSKNCSVAIVGQKQDVIIYEDELVTPFLENMEEKTDRRTAAQAGGQAQAGQVRSWFVWPV